MKTLPCVFIFLFLVGCSTRTEYIKPTIPLPTEPTLPSIKAKELQCITDSTYAKLVERDLLLKEHSEKCLVILKEVTTQ